VEQHGTVAEVLHQPATPYVASLVERARESAAALQA
jgi:ABC-type proline/glycine betaine transport system ATPase subunit